METPDQDQISSNATTNKLSSSIYLQNKDEIEKVFKQFDTNKDGKISASELENVLKAMGCNFSESELKRVMEDVDVNHDGFISPAEFSALCQSSSDAAAAASELRDAFDLYDKDKNGLISASELHQVLNQLGMPCSVEDCVRMIGPVDADGDGNVDFKEFEKMMSTSLNSNRSSS